MDGLTTWLELNIAAPGTTHTCYEVQEDFALGLGEVMRARAAERALLGAKEGVKAVSNGAADVDSKLKISERAHATVEAVSNSAAMKSASAAFSKAGSSVKVATLKITENEKVQTSFKKIGETGTKTFESLKSGFSNFVTRKNSGHEMPAVVVPPEHHEFGMPDEAPEYAPRPTGTH